MTSAPPPPLPPTIRRHPPSAVHHRSATPPDLRSLLAFLRAEYGPQEYGFLPTLPRGVSVHHDSHPFGTGGHDTRSHHAPSSSTATATATATATSTLFDSLAMKVGVWDAGAWGQFWGGSPRIEGVHFINGATYIGSAISSDPEFRRNMSLSPVRMNMQNTSRSEQGAKSDEGEGTWRRQILVQPDASKPWLGHCSMKILPGASVCHRYKDRQSGSKDLVCVC